jgi:D-tyrosyl-tRNA(Tyr) deacylase
MRALLQRVSHAAVTVDGQTVGSCDAGLLILACAMQGDTEAEADRLAGKIARLRIFRDEVGRMNRSILDTQGSALVISQFTLAADTTRGNRPGFSSAAPPEEGRRLFDHFVGQIAAQGIATQTGRFGAEMQVCLTNDGPVTIWIES